MKLTAILFVLLPGAQLGAQALDAKHRKRAVASAARLLAQRYVFADKGEECAKHLRARLEAGGYDELTDRAAFAAALTRDLQAVTKDKHLRVRPAPRAAGARSEPSPAERARRRREVMRRRNYGFQKVEILPGNVGYLDLRAFAPASAAGPTAVAAMGLLAGADALIIDLRQNGGGSPTMIQLLTSYFYPEGRPRHLNSFFRRGQEQIDQFWTLPHVPGKRMPDTPIFVLTSNRTFSAAEEFTYNLKHLERATVVGEVTGGGAHPGGLMPVAGGFQMFVPTGRAINPVTETNWEGTGVKPHIEVPAGKALLVARREAVQKILRSAADPAHKARLQWALAGLRARTDPPAVPPATLALYAGSYGQRTVTLDGGRLFYQRVGRPRYPLRAMTQDLFAVEGVDHFRLRFIVEDGKCVRVVGLYDDGRRDESPRG